MPGQHSLIYRWITTPLITEDLLYSQSKVESPMDSWTGLTIDSMSTTHKEFDMTTSKDGGSTSLSLGSKHEPSIHHLNSEIETSDVSPPLIWYKLRAYGRDAFSEFFGTMILILFGDGVVAQVLLSHGQKGDYQSISWGWGYAFYMKFFSILFFSNNKPPV